MFNLQAVKSILEQEFKLILVPSTHIQNTFVSVAFGITKVEYEAYCRDCGIGLNSKIYINITAYGVGHSDIEIRQFEITDENQLRKWIADIKKIVEFCNNL